MFFTFDFGSEGFIHDDVSFFEILNDIICMDTPVGKLIDQGVG